MSWRNVIISHRCKLDYKMGYLVIRGEDVKRMDTAVKASFHEMRFRWIFLGMLILWIVLCLLT